MQRYVRLSSHLTAGSFLAVCYLDWLAGYNRRENLTRKSSIHGDVSKKRSRSGGSIVNLARWLHTPFGCGLRREVGKVLRMYFNLVLAVGDRVRIVRNTDV